MKFKRLILALLVLVILNQKAFANQIYTVKLGDTLYKISQQYGISIAEILKANPGIKNPSMIYVGQKIVIPNDLRAFEKEVIRLVNIERAKVGLKPLTENLQLSKIARLKSQDMASKGYFSHYSPTYGSPFDMMKKFGIKYTLAGENIAMGQKTPKEVVTAWMNSQGHRRNILNPNFTQIGVGAAKDSRGRIYWTQMFIRP
ncbi:uncharacterized protein, YkwD family [Caloramator fervidus]|uniref:Uncharacterized protein, YkwD family n=1 Tax=Caloramator fervidus TaxID=29344 RepID=A0A1H5RJV4_9CLOT|nr:CAP domain-containing protein [Caloramator fervidus]SEF38636.1 uncharacterized protein, YkwD family [Caloramator fervidus]